MYMYVRRVSAGGYRRIAFCHLPCNALLGPADKHAMQETGAVHRRPIMGLSSIPRPLPATYR